MTPASQRSWTHAHPQSSERRARSFPASVRGSRPMPKRPRQRATIVADAARSPLPHPPRRHLLEIADLDAQEFDALLDLASTMKRHPTAWRHSLEGRTIACVLHAPLVRGPHRHRRPPSTGSARCPLMLTPDALPEDDARMLSSACDGIVIHGARHRDLSDLAAYATVPGGQRAQPRARPVRRAGHCLALRERFGSLDGLSVAYVGPAGALAYSLLQAAPIAQFELRLGLPAGRRWPTRGCWPSRRPAGARRSTTPPGRGRSARRAARRRRRLPTALQPHRRCCTP